MREGPKNSRGVRGHAPSENLLHSLGMHRRVRNFFCYGRPCYYGQPELTQETRKLIAHEQIEHWPKFSASEGTNSEFISTSESLKNIELPTRTVPMREKCSCRRESVRLHRNE